MDIRSELLGALSANKTRRVETRQDSLRFTPSELQAIQQISESPRFKAFCKAHDVDRHTLRDVAVTTLPMGPSLVESLVSKIVRGIQEGALSSDLRLTTALPLNEEEGGDPALVIPAKQDTLGHTGEDAPDEGETNQGVSQHGDHGDHSEIDAEVTEECDDEDDYEVSEDVDDPFGQLLLDGDDEDDVEMKAEALLRMYKQRSLSEGEPNSSEISKADIEALSREAGSAGDKEQVRLCQLALSGDESAWAECEKVIRSFRAEESLDNFGDKKAKPFGSGDEGDDDSEKEVSESNNVPVDDIMRYEQGDMDEEEMIELFQKLVNSGLAWQLQGHYGRTAKALIDAGLVTESKKTKGLCRLRRTVRESTDCEDAEDCPDYSQISPVSSSLQYGGGSPGTGRMEAQADGSFVWVTEEDDPSLTGDMPSAEVDDDESEEIGEALEGEPEDKSGLIKGVTTLAGHLGDEKVQELISKAKWSHTNGCWMLQAFGYTLGIEVDGSVHS